MTDFLAPNAIARAVHFLLSSDAQIAMYLGSPPRLYDHIPEDPVFPYLTYGAIRSEDIGATGADISRHLITLHIWSRYSGRLEAMTIVAAVIRILESNDWEMSESQLVSANVIYSDIFRAPDGRTLHGVIRLNVVTQDLQEAL